MKPAFQKWVPPSHFLNLKKSTFFFPDLEFSPPAIGFGWLIYLQNT